MASERIKQLQAVDLVIEQRYPDRVLRVLSGEDVDDVAPDPESSAPEVRFVAFVLHLGEAFDDFALPQAITDTHRQDHLMVLVAIADTVNTGNRRHDDAIAAFKQAFCRRKAHLLDMLVDRRVFLDKQITCGDVGFWLIVVVVGDEILDGILGEELPEFGVQLRSQCLVWRQNQRRTPHAGDHIGHGVGFSRTCDAEQCLKRQSVFEAFDQP